MGFLKKFIKTTYRDGENQTHRSSFADLSEDQLEEHLAISRYGSFQLTEAIRPAFDLSVVPSAGYRHDVFPDEESYCDIPVLMAAQTRHKLFDTFLDMLDPLGFEVDVYLESSHRQQSGQKAKERVRENIDMPVLKSILCEFENLLLNDGCTGIAIVNPQAPLELQLDEHKLMIAYGQSLHEFEDILCDHGIDHREEIRFISEAEHVHSSTEEFATEFEELCCRLGIDEF